MDLLHPILSVDSTFLSYDDDFNYSMPEWINMPYTSPNYSSIVNKLSEGVQHYLYTGHGSPSGTSVLDYSDLNSSHNGKLFYMMLQACSTGAFHNTNDCMTEEFLSSDMEIGAIAAIGASQTVALWCNVAYIELYKSFFTNYSYVAGENLFESKISFCNTNTQHLLKMYNLFGDPGINIKYENTDTLFPELVIKDFEIGFNPQIPNAGDTLIIRPVIRNMTRVSATNGFYVSCKATHKFNQDTIWIGNVQIDSLSGYTKDTANFQWNTKIEDYGVFNFVFEIDTSNNNPEMNELNNLTSIQKTI